MPAEKRQRLRQQSMPPARVLASRRAFLSDAASGLGAIALAWLLNADTRATGAPANGADVPQGFHFPPKARRAINIFSPGGVSHVDTFDYKPELEKLHGTRLTNKGTLDPF